MWRAQVVKRPAIDRGEGRIELLGKHGRRSSPVVDRDLFRSQAPRLRRRVVQPPDGTDVEHVAGPLPVADGNHRLTAVPPGEAQFPGRLAATVSLDQQAMLLGKTLDGGRDGAKGIDDFSGNWR